MRTCIVVIVINSPALQKRRQNERWYWSPVLV